MTNHVPSIATHASAFSFKCQCHQQVHAEWLSAKVRIRDGVNAFGVNMSVCVCSQFGAVSREEGNSPVWQQQDPLSDSENQC